MTKARDLGDFISDGTIAETVTADGLNLGDNEKIQLGGSQDLQIYHDGSNSYVKDNGTGDLILQASDDVKIQTTSGTNMAVFTEGTYARLFYNGSAKFETTSTGVNVTGTIAVSGSFNATSGTFTVQDNGTNILNVTSTLMSPQTDGAISLGSSSNGFNNMYLDGSAYVSGNIGVGTSSPSEKLVLANSSNEIKFGLDGSSHDIFSNGKTFNIGTTDDTVVRMFQNNSEVMRLSGGNLLVGRSSNLADARTLVTGTKSGTNGTNGLLVVLDEQSYSTTDNGGGISFAGNFYNGGQVVFATVQGVKENNTDANNAGALKFTTKANGANQAERLRITSDGAFGIGGANYGTSGQVLTSSGSGSAPTWADASSGGMTQITSGTIGSNAQYNFSLGSNWWNTYEYVKVIYLATFQSGDPPSGTYHCQFRLNSVSTFSYTYSGQRGSTNNTGSATAGRLTIGSPQDNIPVFIEAEIYTDGTHTFVSARSGSGQSNGSGFASTLVSNQTPTTFNIIQDGFGSERYRFEGPITFYGVK